MATAIQFCPGCHRTYASQQAFCPLDGSPLKQVPETLPDLSTVLNGRYLILSQIGAGGMGVLFRAHDLRARRDVALKVLKPDLAGKENAVLRFFVEARAAGRLSHPNVVELFDYGATREGYLYLAMELLPGTTLAGLLAVRERLTVGEALLVAHGTCEALVHAHENGVVHRDLKPENIFLVAWDRDGYFVKVVDFGVAAIADSRVRGGLGRGEVLGTPAYMSPEQIRGDHVDHRSDLYSLGIFLYEMVNGRPPFLGQGPVETMRMHLSEPLPSLPPLAVSSTVRKGFEGVLASLLARSAGDRCTDAREARARIRAVMDNLAIENADAVDAVLFRETLAPLRSFVPFHDRQTLVVSDLGSEAMEAILATTRPPVPAPAPIDPSPAENPEPDGPETTAGALQASASSSRAATPWTLDPASPRDREGDVEGGITISLVHIELDFGTLDTGILSARTLFAPEMEAFQSATMADGGCVCFDSGEEVRVVFGLYTRGESPWRAAMKAAADLLDRVERFARSTHLPVDARIGVSTDWVPAQTASSVSPDATLRGSTVDVAVRLARMALPGQAVLDDMTRSRVAREFDFTDLGRIRVRGRDRPTRIFGMGGAAAAGLQKAAGAGDR